MTPRHLVQLLWCAFESSTQLCLTLMATRGFAHQTISESFRKISFTDSIVDMLLFVLLRCGILSAVYGLFKVESVVPLLVNLVGASCYVLAKSIVFSFEVYDALGYFVLVFFFISGWLQLCLWLWATHDSRAYEPALDDAEKARLLQRPPSTRQVAFAPPSPGPGERKRSSVRSPRSSNSDDTFASAHDIFHAAVESMGPAFNPDPFCGTWRVVDRTGIEEMLKFQGVGWAKRKAAANVPYTKELRVTAVGFTDHSVAAGLITIDSDFTFGADAIEQNIDGFNMMCRAYIEDDGFVLHRVNQDVGYQSWGRWTVDDNDRLIVAAVAQSLSGSDEVHQTSVFERVVE